jgi:hypothetical protein
VVLIREIGKKNDDGSGGYVDLKAIEGAMKRVLSSQPISVVANSGLALPAGESDVVPVEGEAAPYDPNAAADIQQALQQRDSRIEQLTRELDAARDTAGGGTKDPALVAAQEEAVGLKAKLDELQGRLAEYEIIEDDIADLSMFKEENIKMKAEVAQLKAELAKAATSAAALAISPPPATAPAAPVMAAPALEELANSAPSSSAPESTLDAGSAEPIKFEKTEKFELDINDDIMKEFAAAVHDQRAPPPPVDASVPAIAAAEAGSGSQDPQSAIDALLAADIVVPTAPISRPQDAIDALFSSEVDPLGVLDPDKVQSEAASLIAEPSVGDSDLSVELSGDALEDSLDTEKLLAEVDSLKAGSTPSGDGADEDLLKQFNKAQGS